MRTPVELYINGDRVEFNSPPEILFNYTQTDITNPTLIKNGYSKTFTVESTKTNDQIFRHFWRQDSLIEPGIQFDPSKKLPFILYVDNDVYDQGYVKLEDVVQTGERKEYSVTMYSTIGSFFNNLKYNAETGNELKLSDLKYTEEGGDDELDFVINSGTVRDAWMRLQGIPQAPALFDIINFAPAYNGTPEGLDADKVIVDLEGLDLTDSVLASGVTYDDYNGYALMGLDNKLTEWEVRDLRSYLQRPVVRVRKVIEACCDPRNNGGYTVNLDTDFFNSSNPDWEKAWVTLPLLSDIKYEPQDTSIATITVSDAEGSDTIFWYDITIEDSQVPLNAVSLDVLFSLNPEDENARRNLFNSHITTKRNYGLISEKYSIYRYLSSLFVQLVGYDKDGNAVCASNAKNLTNVIDFNGCQYYGNEDVYKSDSDYGSNAFESALGMPVELVDGFWRYDPGTGKLEWSTGKLTFALEGAENVTTLRLMVKRSALIDKPVDTYSTNKGAYRTVLYFSEAGESTNFIDLNHYSVNTPEVTSERLLTYTDGGIHTNSLITKKMLLNTSFSPCDFLLSYTKIYGLYYLRDNTGKTVSIMTRNNFYQNYVVDINNLVDRGDDISIQPLALERNWYDFKLDVVRGTFAEQYEKTTDFSYGMKRIETGYDFNPEAGNLYEGSIFKTAIQCLEKSPWYMVPQNGLYPSYFGTDIKYSLFNGNDDYEVTERRKTEWVPVNTARYYDCTHKMQFHTDDNKPVDGSNVIVYYNGFKSTKAIDGTSFWYLLTDDIPEMQALNNGNNCWLYTSRSNSQVAYRMATFPQFGRYIVNTAGYVARSLDFGQPRQTYLKDAVINANTEDSTVYNRYWKSYIEDLYNINTRMVSLRLKIKPIRQNNAFVMGDKPNPEWLRYFYWYDNAIWVLNEIRDWDVSSFDTTEVELIKVQDIAHYTTQAPPEIPQYIRPVLDLRSNQTLISQTGGTILITVDSNMAWTASTDVGTISPTAGTGNTVTSAGTDYETITLTVPKFYDQTLPDAPRTITVSATGIVSGITGDFIGDSVTFQQEKWHPGISATPRCTFVQFTGGTFICDWNMENTADADFRIAPVSGWPNQSDIMTIGMSASSVTNSYTVRQWLGLPTNDTNKAKGAAFQAGLVNPDTGATSPWYVYDTWYIVQFPGEVVFDQNGDEAGTTSSAHIDLPAFTIPDLQIVAKSPWVTVTKSMGGLNFYCSQNNDYDREGSFVIYHPEYGQVVIGIRQLGAVFVTPAHRAQGRRTGIGFAYPTDDGLSFTNNYSTMSMPVEDTGSGNTYWSATTDSSWITLANASATGAGVILVTVNENPNASARTGMVTIHSESADTSFMVHQSDWSGGTGGNDIVELTQAEYDELVEESAVTEGVIYVITDAQCFNPSDYLTSGSVQVVQIQETGTPIATITVSGNSTNIYAPTGGSTGSTVSWNQIQTGGTKIAEITINNSTTDVYTPSGFTTSGEVVNIIATALTDGHYTTSASFKTINSESIVGSGNIVIPTGRTEVEVTAVVTAGTKIATIEVDDVPTDIYAPSGGSTDLTHYWDSATTQSAITEATRYQVSSTTVHNIIALSQQAYENISAHSPTTLYIINS